MVNQSVESLASIITCNKPLADIPLFRLEQMAEQFHGAGLYAMLQDNEEDFVWLSYLSVTFTHAANYKRGISNGLH